MPAPIGPGVPQLNHQDRSWKRADGSVKLKAVTLRTSTLLISLVAILGAGASIAAEPQPLPASFWSDCVGTRFDSMHVVMCKSGLRLSWGQTPHPGPPPPKDERLHFGIKLPPNGCSNQLNSINGARLYALKIEAVDMKWPNARGVTWKDTLETTAVSASFIDVKKEIETRVACTAPDSAQVSCLEVVRTVGVTGLPSKLSFARPSSVRFLDELYVVPKGCKSITGADISCNNVKLNWQCKPGKRDREAPPVTVTDCFSLVTPAPKTFACRVAGHDGECTQEEPKGSAEWWPCPGFVDSWLSGFQGPHRAYLVGHGAQSAIR